MDLDPLINVLTRAAGTAVAHMFNSTPTPLRPIAMAAIRSSVDSAVATFDEDQRRLYEIALAGLIATTVKIPRKGRE